MPTVAIQHQPLVSNGQARGGNVGIIQTFFDYCVNLLFTHAPNHPCSQSELRVRYIGKGPHVRYGGNAQGGFDIDLTSQGDAWDQHAYQFAHELCHVYSRSFRNEVAYDRNIFPNQWFEEALCETASIYCLFQIAAAEENGPCQYHRIHAPGSAHHQGPYYQTVSEHYQELLKSPDREQPTDFRTCLTSIEQHLRKNPYRPYCRAQTQTLANRLLPLFRDNPSYWQAVAHLNDNPCQPGVDSFRQYLKNWRASTPVALRGFIDEVERLLV